MARRWARRAQVDSIRRQVLSDAIRGFGHHKRERRRYEIVVLLHHYQYSNWRETYQQSRQVVFERCVGNKDAFTIFYLRI